MALLKPLKIEKNKMADFLDALTREYRVIAPVRRDGMVVYAEVNSGREALEGRNILLNHGNSRKSPKELFFPQNEVLFSYDSSKGETKLTEPALDLRQTIVFGIRPCDARGILMLDKVFLQPGREDVNYKQRRDNTIILAVGCTKPGPTCFCTSMNGGPFDVEGEDALFIDIGDSFIVEAHTGKGKELLGKHLTAEADDNSLKMAGEVKQKALDLITTKVDARRASELKLLDVFSSPLWNTIHEKCIGCGTCAFICPTCSCFDVVDETDGTAGDRIRVWEPCTFSVYTLQASGFNPRPSGKERLRQRVMHKVMYTTASSGELSCVGCGRCVANCPVNLDIRQVINTLVGGVP